MIAGIIAASAASAAALPLIGRAWARRATPLPSIFNLKVEHLTRGRQALWAASVFGTCMTCGLKLAASGADPLRTLAGVGAVGAFGCTAAIDASYRLVPRALAVAGACLAVASGGADAPARLLAAAFSGGVVWGGALVFEAASGKEAAGIGDAVLAMHVGATFGFDMARWGAFLVAATVASGAALMYMRWKDNDDMVPLYALMLLPYLTGVLAGA